MKVSLIIPTLNEEEAIVKVLKDVPPVVNEVIIVDSSNDDTSKLAQSFGVEIVHEERLGYGRALQTGIEKASGDIIVYMDGDCTYNPKEISCIVQPIIEGTYDVVLGSRLKGKMLHGSMNRLNKIGNLVLSLVFNALFFKRISDTQTGFRAVKRPLLNGLSYRDYGMSYATEQLVQLVKMNIRISEVPITYHPRIGKTKLHPLPDGFKILKVILREKFTLR